MAAMLRCTPALVIMMTVMMMVMMVMYVLLEPTECQSAAEGTSLQYVTSGLLFPSNIIRLHRSRRAAARSNFPGDDLSVSRSVCASVRASVCPVHCENTADRIRMPFSIIGRTSPGMSQVVGFGDWSTRRGIFGGEFGARRCNQ